MSSLLSVVTKLSTASASSCLNMVNAECNFSCDWLVLDVVMAHNIGTHTEACLTSLPLRHSSHSSTSADVSE